MRASNPSEFNIDLIGSSKKQQYKWLKKWVETSTSWEPPNAPVKSIRLDLNENQYINKKDIADLVENIDWSAAHQYPDYDCLNEALSLESSAPKENILATNGADQAIEIIIRSLNPLHRVLLAVPTFSYYQHVLGIEGLQVEKISYSLDFSLDIEKLIGSISEKTSCIFLTSPSNPLTTVISEQDIVSILEKAEQYGAVLVVDEVYANFTGQNLGYLLDYFSNLILIRSFSKYYGLASARMGYLLSSPHIIKQLRKVRGPWDISSVSAQLVSTVISCPVWLNYIPVMHKNRDTLSQCLTLAGAFVVDSKINFIIFFHQQSHDLYAHLRKNGVVVSLMDEYPDSNGLLTGFIRMSVPNDTQLDIVLNLVGEFFH